MDFVRVENYVFGHVADEGLVNSCAGKLLRYRKSIGAENIAIFSDIKKKHSSHSITADVSISETAHAAKFFLADGVILTGSSTGQPASVNELKGIKISIQTKKNFFFWQNVFLDLREKVKFPIFIGSGITTENAQDFKLADAFIVGSYFKKDGHWRNELEPKKIEALVGKVETLKKI